MECQLHWEALEIKDADAVNIIADRVHVELPERQEVFLEKIRLYPEGCRKLVGAAVTVGYGISHPWLLNEIPPLDAFLGGLPTQPECIYIHDVAVLPEARGHGAAAHYVEYIKELATTRKIPALALVSVYGTDPLWSHFGFKVIHDQRLAEKLITYGASAKYMVCSLYD